MKHVQSAGIVADVDAIDCPQCGKKAAVLRRTPTALEVRGLSVETTRVHRVCEACGADFENTVDPDWRLDAFAKYRSKMGYVTPDQIRQWRASKGLTQAEVGELLGFGEATLGRYEKGALQTAANNATLARIMTASGLIDAIDDKPHVLSADKRHRLISENSAESADAAAKALLRNIMQQDVDAEFNGGRELSFNRVSSFVCKLANQGRSKTVLNKMMFYSDFLAYREYGKSISGLCYARLPYGPVPNNYNSLFGILSAVKIIHIEPKPAGEYLSDFIRASDRRMFLTRDFGKDEAILRYVCGRFENFSAKKISDYSHNEKAWKEVAPCSLIPYSFAEFLQI